MDIEAERVLFMIHDFFTEFHSRFHKCLLTLFASASIRR
jgi:hypothetical protein